MTETNFLDCLKELSLFPNDVQLSQFKRYYELLVEWNEKINLTAITEKNQVYLKHFYDSLTLVRAIDFSSISTVCDVGTGAGFPGIVLKIMYPHLKITLIDALNKRLQFLNLVITELGLSDIETVHARSEDYAVSHREMYDLVTARAVASLPILMEYCTPLVKVNGYFIPMKGDISQEIVGIDTVYSKLYVHLLEKIELELPYEGSKRTLLKFIKEKKTDLKFPRKYVDMKKKPVF